MFLTLKDFKKRIEFSLVPNFLNDKEIKRGCIQAINAGVGVICINPDYVKFVKNLIGDKDINLSANIGFPWGTHSTEFKVLETEKALQDGANQIDMVINVGALRSGKYQVVFDDIQGVVKAAKKFFVKAIIETWVLNQSQKIKACKLAEKAGVNLIKTTTGVRTQYLEAFCGIKTPKGAELEDIILFRKILHANTRIKASGGVYSVDDALKMIKAGADQLGASKGIELIKEFEKRFKNGVEI